MTTTQPEGAGKGASEEGHQPLEITHAAMNAAFDKGTAAMLSASATWLVRYRDAWWVVYERGWLRITDTATNRDLDQAAERLRQAEAADDDLGRDNPCPAPHCCNGTELNG